MSSITPMHSVQETQMIISCTNTTTPTLSTATNNNQGLKYAAMETTSVIPLTTPSLDPITEDESDKCNRPFVVKGMWWFIILFSIYTFAKYPFVIKAFLKNETYYMSSIIDGKVPATSPFWFLILHIPLMIVSNISAAIAFGFSRRKTSNQSRYMPFALPILCEVLNGILLMPVEVHTRIGTMDVNVATLFNFGVVIPTLVCLGISILLYTRREQQQQQHQKQMATYEKYLCAAYGYKNIIVFVGEVIARIFL
jgi:hypothetical protein